MLALQLALMLADPPLAPPRVDGVILGVDVRGVLGTARVADLDAADAFAGTGLTLTVGEVVTPWLALGLRFSGAYSYAEVAGARQRLGHAALLAHFRLMPVPRIPLSIIGGAGVGGGAVREEGFDGRSGFGGAAFETSARYEWFPFAKRRRPTRAGGWAIGAELGWAAFPPAARKRPMGHSYFLGLTTTMYFGR